MTRTTTKERKGSRRRDLEEESDVLERDDEPEEDDGGEEEQSRDNGGSSGGVFAELKNVASDAALSVLGPVAKQAATSAAKFAVKKAPELLEDTVMPMLEDAGGVKGLVGQAMSSDGPAGGMLSKLKGGDDEKGGGDAGDGTGKGRRMPIQQAVDVAAPIDVVYDQWTQFEDYPKFMHRVQRVEQRDDSHVAFHAKVWGINRMWEAEIVEQRPDERIVFKSVNGVQITGVVTFHDMAERLTHIELNIDVDPDGPIEKIARGARFVKRAARGDLKRFKAYVEMHEDETGAWRGEIQDGDVVSESDEDRDEGREDEERDDEERDGEYMEDEASSEEEYDEEEPEDEDERDEDEEEEEKPRARKSSTKSRKAKSSNGGDPKQKRASQSRSRGSKNGSSKSSSSSSTSRSSSRGKSSSRSKSRSKAGGRK